MSSDQRLSRHEVHPPSDFRRLHHRHLRPGAGGLRRPAGRHLVIGRLSPRLLTAALAMMLVSCSTSAPEPAPPVAVPTAPPIALSRDIAEAASIYVVFIREMAESRAGFPDAASVQTLLSQGAAYEPHQLSRGMIAYASILALQSPEFTSGVRAFALDPDQRWQVVAAIIADPAYAATLPGADAAAGLILGVLDKDIRALTSVADAIEADAYTIQERQDPRRRWAAQTVADRPGRLENAKSLSAQFMQPSADDAGRLFAAAHAGTSLDPTPGQLNAPYTPVVIQALAIAALAALGAADDEARPQTAALLSQSDSEFCLALSKLNLFQCLAASRPSYEDMFCLGRHVIRDLATCTEASIVG